MKKQKFLRTDSHQYSKLGLRRKKKQKYRKGKGGENKIRLKMKGHLRNVTSGFKNEKKTRNLINGMKPVQIFNLNDLGKIKQGEIAVVGKIGNKNKMKIAEHALKNKIKLANLNPKKFLEKMEIKLKQIKEQKIMRDEKKKIRDKKAKENEKKKAEKESKKEKSEEKSENPANVKSEENKK